MFCFLIANRSKSHMVSYQEERKRKQGERNQKQEERNRKKEERKRKQKEQKTV